MIQTYAVDPELTVTCRSERLVDPTTRVQAQIDKIWATELARRSPPPFNGNLLSVVSHSPRTIVSTKTDYKTYLAQSRNPALFDDLKVSPLAVTGLLVCRDGVVFGKRSSGVEQDKNLWELVPSGSVDGTKLLPDGAVDFSDNILEELREEIGVAKNHIATPPRPFALVHDLTSHVFDVALILRTDLAQQQIVAKFNELENDEYTDLEIVDVGRLEDFAISKSAELAAVSKALLEKIDYSLGAN
jgi:hypothetical protein